MVAHVRNSIVQKTEAGGSVRALGQLEEHRVPAAGCGAQTCNSSPWEAEVRSEFKSSMNYTREGGKEWVVGGWRRQIKGDGPATLSTVRT